MADILTTTSQIDPAVQVTYDRILLERAIPSLVHERFANRKNLKRRSGNTIKMRRYANLSTATTPLADNGLNPPGQQLSKTDITATISWYGDFVHVTDVVDMTVEDAVLVEAAELQGQQRGETRDELVRDVMVATASVTNASGGTNGNTPTEITKSDISGVVITMMDNNCKMVTPKLKASTGQGTAPVRAGYWGIIHTQLIDDLRDVSDYRGVHEYPNGSGEADEEGYAGGVRWLYSSVADKTEGSPDTYRLPIMGANAYAVTDLEGAAQFIFHDFGSAGTADPLNRTATSGWKEAFVSRILNDNWIHCLNVSHS